MSDLYFLAGYPVYREFDADDIDVLGGICEEIAVTKGGVVFRENDAGDSMYIVKAGSVNILKTIDSVNRQVAVISEGEFFGEMALVENSPRSASAEAGEDVELIRLSTEGFKRLKNEFAKTGFKVVDVLLKFMSQRIRRTTNTAVKLQKEQKKIREKPRKKKKTAKKAVVKEARKKIPAGKRR
ncbi:MAG TPA: cyclic nucleotide-binding domain-containing protein [Firmicutes bacterium]|nr:cyclic nucleotide-binding domain-containing protein [Bacillota bacterium]